MELRRRRRRGKQRARRVGVHLLSSFTYYSANRKGKRRGRRRTN